MERSTLNTLIALGLLILCMLIYHIVSIAPKPAHAQHFHKGVGSNYNVIHDVQLYANLSPRGNWNNRAWGVSHIGCFGGECKTLDGKSTKGEPPTVDQCKQICDKSDECTGFHIYQGTKGRGGCLYANKSWTATPYKQTQKVNEWDVYYKSQYNIHS